MPAAERSEKATVKHEDDVLLPSEIGKA